MSPTAKVNMVLILILFVLSVTQRMAQAKMSGAVIIYTVIFAGSALMLFLGLMAGQFPQNANSIEPAITVTQAVFGMVFSWTGLFRLKDKD